MHNTPLAVFLAIYGPNNDYKPRLACFHYDARTDLGLQAIILWLLLGQASLTDRRVARGLVLALTPAHGLANIALLVVLGGKPQRG